jgi:XTP/dITP diphosphohydrolase
MSGKTSLVYVTGNKVKFQVASQVMREVGIDLIQVDLQVPEIQSPQVEVVVKHSAIWASQHLDQPFVVTDAGFYIEALNGFPGPFVRYVNEWLSVQDYLQLMAGKEDRRVIVRECLAYCVPTQQPVIYSQVHQGQLAIKPGRRKGTSMDQIFIPAAGTIPVSEMSAEQMTAHWSKISIWHKLKEHLLSQAQTENWK